VHYGERPLQIQCELSASAHEVGRHGLRERVGASMRDARNDPPLSGARRHGQGLLALPIRNAIPLAVAPNVGLGPARHSDAAR
jgi:hypothetical protein